MQDKETTMEATAKTRTYGAFRCLNCFTRLTPPLGVKEYKCPYCGFEWRVFWLGPNLPRIRGPVWDVDRKLAEEAMSKKVKVVK